MYKMVTCILGGTALSNDKKRISINSDFIILLGLGIIVLFFALCSRGSAAFFKGESGGCIAIAFFGKLELRNVDKVVVQVDGREIVSTAPELLEKIVSETAVATHASICHHEERRLDLYRGDKLVRSMVWDTGHDTIKVYDSDIFHWVFTPISIEKEGYVIMSDDLRNQLNALVASSN